METAELEEYRRQFEQIQSQTKELAAGLDEAQFNWRPASGAWSIEECLAHLTIVGGWEIAAIERAIERGKTRGLTGAPPFRYGWLDRFLVRATEPPVRYKVSAPRRFRPLHGQPVTAILPTFLHLQGRFLLQLERARGLDLARVKVDTPISRFLKMSLGMMFAQAAAHERRHLEQARRVRSILPA
ncbi:MAG: DinB family protein [Acidobacteriia bacterium]|nr:DinB family protein [Terriglobia bacterium]